MYEPNISQMALIYMYDQVLKTPKTVNYMEKNPLQLKKSLSFIQF